MAISNAQNGVARLSLFLDLPLSRTVQQKEVSKEIPLVKTERWFYNVKCRKLKLIFELLDICSNLAPSSDSNTQQNVMPVTVLNVGCTKTVPRTHRHLTMSRSGAVRNKTIRV